MWLASLTRHCKQVAGFVALSVCLFLASCTGQPVDDAKNESRELVITEPGNAFILEAWRFFQQGDCESAQLFIDAAMTDPLEASDIVAITRINSHCYRQSNQQALALQSLQNNAIQEIWPRLPAAIQLELGMVHAQLLDYLDQPIDSARHYIAIAPLASEPQQQQELFLAAWTVLAQARREQIELALQFEEDPIRPWLELANIARDNESGIDYQLQQVFDWQQRWAGHPISQQLPREFTELQNLAQNQPKSIALLLPLSGKLAATGKAIRDGFISGLYQQLATTGNAPSLKIYDSASGDFLTTYENIVNSDAEFIVGPLDKSRVKLLFGLLDIPKPTLALNEIQQEGSVPANLYQFALDAEEEARQLADMSWVDGHRKVLVLGSNTYWSQRSIQAFSDRWEELGGDIGDRELFQQPKNYSRKVEQLLELDHSHLRARKLQDRIGKLMEYIPRRRQDIDAIILFANPEQGRALNPLFAFHYANDLPVYSSSRIFNGQNFDKANLDLKGIKFIDMPWLLDSPALRDKLLQLAGPDYSRVQAFGIDAFMIYPRLPLLSALPEARLPGQTGLLSLNSSRKIQRELAWAQFAETEVRTLPRKQIDEIPAADEEPPATQTPDIEQSRPGEETPLQEETTSP